MAINNNNKTNFLLAIVVSTMLVLCVSVAAAQLVRSSPANADRVYDFTIAETKDSASWTAFGRQWTVRLELSDVTEDNTDYYHGTLDGSVDAVVSFALLPGQGLSGMIVDQDVTWWISAQPVPEFAYAADDDSKLGVFMTREALASVDNFNMPSFDEPLQSDEEEAVVESESESETETTNADRKRVVTSYKVGVFYDQKWASASNNPWSSQAATLGLLNDVNAVYKAAGLNTFTFVYMKQLSNPKTTLSTMLSYFSDTASKSLSAMSDKSYTNYVWLVGSNVGGLAWVGTSCKSSSTQTRKTAVTGLVNYSRLWSVKTIAHELGHNRGASHEFTNACSGSLKTGCQCSVMSYCFPSSSNNPKGAVNFFSDVTINQMKKAGCY